MEFAYLNTYIRKNRKLEPIDEIFLIGSGHTLL